MTRYGPFGEDDLEDDEGWSEIVDAIVPRVDLVGHGANGTRGFLLMKSEEGLMTPAQIRALLASNTPQKVNTPMRPSDYIPGTNILRTSVDLRKAAVLRKSAALRKASKPSLVAVYDATGKLIGTCDSAKITVLQSAENPDATKAPAAPKPKASTPAPSTAPEATPAPQQQPDATDGPAAGRSAPVPAAAADAAQEVKKALAGCGFRDAHSFAPARGRSVDARYSDLIKSVDRGTQGPLGDAVANAALRFQYSSGISGQEAVRISKSLALDAAAIEVRRPKPSIEAAAARVFKRPLR